MKRIIFITLIVFSTSFLCAQRDTIFYKHEVRASIGDAVIGTFWWGDDDNNNSSAFLFAHLSFSYFYRPLRWLWIGGNFVNYFGENMHYNLREYAVDGSYKDFTKTKIKYCAVIAPEIRFSYLNRKSISIYTALSGGICVENGFDSSNHYYPDINYYFQLTYFGFSCNFGKNNAIFLGAEMGLGMKGFGSMHGGYRF